MSAAMSAVMLASAATGACCSVWAFRGMRVPALLLNILMAVLSIDLLHAALTGGDTRIPVIAWAATLIGAAMLTAATHTRWRGILLPHHRAMSAHRSVGAIVMAAALLVPHRLVATTSDAHSHSGSSASLMLLLAGGTVAVLALAVVAVVPLRGRARIIALIECAAMTASCAVMTGWQWLG